MVVGGVPKHQHHYVSLCSDGDLVHAPLAILRTVPDWAIATAPRNDVRQLLYNVLYAWDLDARDSPALCAIRALVRKIIAAGMTQHMRPDAA